jgi:hypothetical protein
MLYDRREGLFRDYALSACSYSSAVHRLLGAQSESILDYCELKRVADEAGKQREKAWLQLREYMERRRSRISN